MTGYMLNFGVYTFAMVGLIVMAIFVYKKSSTICGEKKSSLKIDDKIALNARKSLYVVNAGGERFLIAGDIDNTSLIAKLGQSSDMVGNEIKSFNLTKEEEGMQNRKPFVSRESKNIKLPEIKTEYTQADKALNNAFDRVEPIKFEKYLDVKNIRKKPVMKELARKLAEI